MQAEVLTESVLGDIEAGEKALTPKQAGKHPFLNCDQCSVFRYFERGRSGVRLEFAQLPTGRVTSDSAIRRFCERLTAAANGEPVPVRSRRQRHREVSAASARLAKAGL